MPLFAELRGDVPYEFYVPGVTAGTAQELPVLRAPFNMLVTAAIWTPNAAVTANGTNFATISLRNRTTGAGTALPAGRSYAATNSAAFVPDVMALSGTATDLQVAAGDQLTVQIVHSGTGLVIPPGIVQVSLRGR